MIMNSESKETVSATFLEKEDMFSEDLPLIPFIPINPSSKEMSEDLEKEDQIEI